MSDCAYGRNIPLGQWGPVKMSGCAYGRNSPLGQVRSTTKAFLFLLRVRLANKYRLILVGEAVSFVRVLATATVVVVLSAHVGHYPNHRTEDDRDCGSGQYPDETDSRSNNNQPGLVRQSYSDKKHKGFGD